MWIFTPHGFYSIVEDRTNPEQLQVRARVREDLEAFGRQMAHPAPILTTPAADYPYRMVLPRDIVVQAVATMAGSIDYPNFKNRVDEVQGQQRHDLYGHVWEVIWRGLSKFRPKGDRHTTTARMF